MKRLTILCALLLPAVAMGDAPYLPDDAQARERKLWEQTGVPWVEGMRFYKVKRVSQQLSIINSEHVHGIYDAETDVRSIFSGALPNTNKKTIWAAPGGLSWSPRNQWRNATGVMLPGKVQVWRELTKVTNSTGSTQDNARLAWAFPEGTIFCDLLIRTHEGQEWPFELRLREKRNGEWEATAFRPYADESELPAGSRKREYAVSSIDKKIPARDLAAWIVPDPLPQVGRGFKASRLAMSAGDRDDAFVPRHYIGNTTACVNCHSRAGESEGYDGVAAPGSDQAISFHPFKLDTLNTNRFPVIETAWATYIGFRGRNVDHLGRPQR